MDGNSANSNSNDSDVEVKEKENKSRESHSTSSNPDITRTTIAVPAPAPAPAASASAVETEEKERARKNVVHIGTRRSELARRQTAIVEEALREAWRGHGHAHGHGHEETGAGVKEAAPATSTEASSSSSSSSSPPPHLLDKTRDIEFIVHAMSTAGDKNQVTALHEFGAKALWTQELEVGLLDGSLDMVVHSLKDMPTQLPPALTIGAIFPREDPRDALVLCKSLTKPNKDTDVNTNTNTSSITTADTATNAAHSAFALASASAFAPVTTADSILSSLPPGSVIGTSSVRRIAQLRRQYPHLQFADVRGNIQTRLAKLDGDFRTAPAPAPASAVADEKIEQANQQNLQPDYSALILASAGLKRLNLHHRISAHLSRARTHGHMLHAVGQGALAIEIRASDPRMHTLLARVGCERTTRACLAERNLLRVLEGGCSVPIGVETCWDVVDDVVVGNDGDKEGDDNDGDENNDNDDGNDNKEANNRARAKSKSDMPVKKDKGGELTMHAAVLSTDGTRAVEATASRHIISRADADAFGKDVAAILIDRGAAAILREIELDRSIIEAQGGA